MLFIVISVILVFVVPIVWAIFFGEDGFFSWFLSGILMMCATGILGMALWVIALATSTTEHSYQVNLRALGADSAIDGHSYFLGGGYVKEKGVLNYIAEVENGGVKLYRVEAADSVIYERDSDPSVTISYKHTELEWLVPFKSDWQFTYDFYIPEGSVLQNYTITN